MDLKEMLLRQNPWWRNGEVRESLRFRIEREELGTILDSLEKKRILSIVGPRRVGKSTLMKQAISHLLASGTKPLEILFFSCDDPYLLMSGITIADLIGLYENEILHLRLEDSERRVHVFIDEIHMAADWQLHLKSFYDRGLPVKFVVSGSSATQLFHGTRESLLGRIEDLPVQPLSFFQFQRFHEAYRPPLGLEGFWELLPKTPFFMDPRGYQEALSKVAWKLSPFRPKLGRILGDFLLRGGYPESFDHENLSDWFRILGEDILDRGLYRDIVRTYAITTPARLEAIVHVLAANSGQVHALSTLADTVGISRDTATVYLHYLEDAYLVAVQDNHSSNVTKTVRRNKKIHLMDHGIVNAVLRRESLTPEAEGQVVEDCCVKEARGSASQRLDRVEYWRDRDREVDIVLTRGTQVLGIEVKYRTQVDESGLAGLIRFREEFAPAQIAVVTKDRLDSKNGIAYVPFWMIR